LLGEKNFDGVQNRGGTGKWGGGGFGVKSKRKLKTAKMEGKAKRSAC